MKIYQTVLTAIAVPTTAMLTLTGSASPSVLGLVTGTYQSNSGLEKLGLIGKMHLK